MEKPLFPSCEEFSVLSFLLNLMRVKVTSKWTNTLIDLLLSLLNRAFKDIKLPKSNSEAKKYLRRLSLGYESIQVCKWDYALFLKENAEMKTCPICGTSRWVDAKTKAKKYHIRHCDIFH